MATPLPAAAFDPFDSGKVDCTGAASTSAVCTDRLTGNPNDPSFDANNPISGSNGVLLKITRIVAFVGGIAAVIMLIIGGLRYITSNGDSNAIHSAKSTVVGALIGLFVIVLAASLITFVIDKL